MISGLLVLLKPVGGRCQLACPYCYYRTGEGPGPVLDLETVAALAAQRFAAADPAEDPVGFVWHGGEPTLAGLAWFRGAAEAVRRAAPPGRRWHHNLQTNGLALDGAWADFLAREGWSVGLSLDGAPAHHDPWRPEAGGQATHGRVVAAARLLADRQVPVSLLTVVHPGNVGDPDGVWDTLEALGIRRWSFLPLTEVNPQALGAFLSRILDRWLAEGVGRLGIQNLDEAFRTVAGVPHALCIHQAECGRVPVVEADGGFYACDHFVDPDHRWGTFGPRGPGTSSLEALALDPRQGAFGRAKAQDRSPRCSRCPVLDFCQGGCPKDWDEGGLNRLCPAYLRFFTEARDRLGPLADHWRAGKPLGTYRDPGPRPPNHPKIILDSPDSKGLKTDKCL